MFFNNYLVMHARTAFEDDADAGFRRHLLRLWLDVPGGRPAPKEMHIHGTAGNRPPGGEDAHRRRGCLQGVAAGGGPTAGRHGRGNSVDKRRKRARSLGRNGRYRPLLRAHAASRSHLRRGDALPGAVRRARYGAALLFELFHHLTERRVTYTHEWTEGDLVIYDNRNLLHSGTWYDADAHIRIMWRTAETVRSTRPRSYPPLARMRRRSLNACSMGSTVTPSR